jgi:hypothetical protein
MLAVDLYPGAKRYAFVKVRNRRLPNNSYRSADSSALFDQSFSLLPTFPQPE